MTIPLNNYVPSQNGGPAPHPEVVALLPRLETGAVLDLGCGDGRNALFLQHQGFTVSAWHNATDALRPLPQRQNDSTLTLESVDLNHHRFNGQYQAILAIESLMHLAPNAVPQVIADMQAATCKRGYNLIICAMHTAEMPTVEGFSFTFSSGELSHYYRRWHIVHYHEQTQIWTPPEAQATPISLRVATLLAQKVAVKDL